MISDLWARFNSERNYMTVKQFKNKPAGTTFVIINGGFEEYWTKGSHCPFNILEATWSDGGDSHVECFIILFTGRNIYKRKWTRRIASILNVPPSTILCFNIRNKREVYYEEQERLQALGDI